MPSKDSVVKTARMNRETWEEIERVMDAEGVTFSGAIKKLVDERVHPKKPEKGREGIPQGNGLDMVEEEYQDLVKMCEVSGIGLGKFMGMVYQLFRDGEIYIDGRIVKAKGKYDIRELEDICHRVNADPQDMINRLTKSLLRG